jgi:hypothetical protein
VHASYALYYCVSTELEFNPEYDSSRLPQRLNRRRQAACTVTRRPFRSARHSLLVRRLVCLLGRACVSCFSVRLAGLCLLRASRVCRLDDGVCRVSRRGPREWTARQPALAPPCKRDWLPPLVRWKRGSSCAHVFTQADRHSFLRRLPHPLARSPKRPRCPHQQQPHPPLEEEPSRRTNAKRMERESSWSVGEIDAASEDELLQSAAS